MYTPFPIVPLPISTRTHKEPKAYWKLRYSGQKMVLAQKKKWSLSRHCVRDFRRPPPPPPLLSRDFDVIPFPWFMKRDTKCSNTYERKVWINALCSAEQKRNYAVRDSHYPQRFQAGQGVPLDTLQLIVADNSENSSVIFFFFLFSFLRLENATLENVFIRDRIEMENRAR